MSDMIPEGSAPIEMPATNPASPAPASAPEVAPQPEISPAAQQYQREREMFSKGAEATGTPLPGNFNSFEDYFDSLKSAQGQFTEARQELSELRAKMAMEGVRVVLGYGNRLRCHTMLGDDDGDAGR